MAKLIGVYLACLATLAFGDIYLQNPRGSNNRLDDENRDRNNANRVFDSQNNNRGGYNVGSLYYYQGSIVPIEWTAQHSCGGPNNNCELIIQYLCDDKLRDGTQQGTIPTSANQCNNFDCDSDVRYGRHESFDWYLNCQQRERNKGLFTANQRLRGNGAIYTRQNPNGDRRGYECPEERDYYPYWAPTPWRDIAVLTNNPRRCAQYQAESQNVKGRWYCDVPEGYKKQMANRNGFIPITQEKCETEVSYFDRETNRTLTGVWKQHPAWNIAAPVCRDNDWSRDNHLGNTKGGYPATFNWTVPADFSHERCVLRLRYNVSSEDFGPVGTSNFLDDYSVQSSAYLNASLNNDRNDANRYPAWVDVWSKFRLSRADVEDSFLDGKNGNAATLVNSREYVAKNNPNVNIFGSLVNAVVKLQINLDTTQFFGRTFQDRTHRFAIRPRPAGLGKARIHNVNVRGKRGNIVQTFPGTEYDFVPTRLEVQVGDYVHFQWTGSNTNPNNNAGQGRQGSDRSNVVGLSGAVYTESGVLTSPPTYGHWGRSFPGRIDQLQGGNFLGWSKELLKRLAILETPGGHMGGEMSELDDAGTYFDLGPQKVTTTGIYHYLCTRNNNFSNRGQKAKIVVRESSVTTEALGVLGGSVHGAGSTMVWAAQEALSSLVTLSVENIPSSKADTSFSGASSDFVLVQPVQLPLQAGRTLTIVVPYDNMPLQKVSMYHAVDPKGEWTLVRASFSNGKATTEATQGGYYVVRAKADWGAIAGIIVGCLVFVVGVAGGIWYYRKKKAAGGTSSRV